MCYMSRLLLLKCVFFRTTTTSPGQIQRNWKHRLATTSKPLRVATLQCSLGKLWILAFILMPIDTNHPNPLADQETLPGTPKCHWCLQRDNECCHTTKLAQKLPEQCDKIMMQGGPIVGEAWLLPVET